MANFCHNFDSQNKKIKSKINNRKKIVMIVCVLFVLFVGIGVWLFYNHSHDNMVDSSQVRETVTCFFDTYCSKSGEANNYLALTSIDQAPITYEGYQGYCAEKINYKIMDVSKIDSDSKLVSVSVEIQNIDLNAVLNRLNEKTFDNDEEIIDYFYSLIQSDDVPTRTYQCDIKCKQYPTGIKIILDAELANALLGGYSAFLSGNNE